MASKALQNAVEFVCFDDLCDRPLETLRCLEAHRETLGGDGHRDALAARLHSPTYYWPTFTAVEEKAIEAETCEVVRRSSIERCHHICIGLLHEYGQSYTTTLRNITSLAIRFSMRQYNWKIPLAQQRVTTTDEARPAQSVTSILGSAKQ